MFDQAIIRDAGEKLNAETNIIYQCKLVRYDRRVFDVAQRELNGSQGWIPESENTEWKFPVLQFPNGEPKPDELATVFFIREPRKDGKGTRNVVRVYRLPDESQSKKALYRLTAVYIKDVYTAWPLLGEEKNCRFAVTGSAENQGDWEDKQGRKDYCIIAVAMSDEPVFAKYRENEDSFPQQVEF